MKRRKRTKSGSYYDSIRDERDAWRDRQKQQCMLCRRKRHFLGFQIHEITRRSAAQNRWWHPCNALLLCEPCHSGPIASMPAAQQLAIKYFRNRSDFDLDAWLRIADPELRAPERVTMADIMSYAGTLEGFQTTAI